MNENNPHDPWSHLAQAARHEHQDDSTPPPGFVTRVAARGLEARQRSAVPALERLWLRGLGLAGVVAALAVLVGWSDLTALNDWASSPELQLISQGVL